jgi:hypothetical protein
MKILLSALADNTLTGLARWYAEKHVLRCNRCTHALADLRVLLTRLQQLGHTESPAEAENIVLTAARRAAMESAWQALDREAEVGEAKK